VSHFSCQSQQKSSELETVSHNHHKD